MWSFTTSTTLKVCCCFNFFQCLRCAVLISSIRICNTNIENWKFVDTSRKYWKNSWMLSVFKVGVGNSSVYRVNLNDLTTAATLQINMVSSIGTLFYTYWDVFEFWIKISWLPRYCPVIDCVFFGTGDTFDSISFIISVWYRT